MSHLTGYLGGAQASGFKLVKRVVDRLGEDTTQVQQPLDRVLYRRMYLNVLLPPASLSWTSICRKTDTHCERQKSLHLSNDSIAVKYNIV